MSYNIILLQFGVDPWMHETEVSKEHYPPGPLCGIGSEQQTCGVLRTEANGDVVAARTQSVCVHLRSANKDHIHTGETTGEHLKNVFNFVPK